MSNVGGVDPNNTSVNDMIRNKNQVGAQNLETDKKTKEESTSTPPEESYIPAPKSMEQIEIQVPMLVPKFFMEAGPDGKKAIDDFKPQQLAPGVMGYMPPDTIVTNAREVQDFKKQIQEETLPPGMKPVIADSLDAKKVDVGMKLASRLLQTAGGFAAYSMTGGPMGMSIPTGIAAPLAAAGGILGVVDGVTQIKEGLNHKQYMQQLKASGVEETVFPIIVKQDASGKEIGKTLVNAPVMRKKGETIEYQAMNVPLDAVIASMKDSKDEAGLKKLQELKDGGYISMATPVLIKKDEKGAVVAQQPIPQTVYLKQGETVSFDRKTMSMDELIAGTRDQVVVGALMTATSGLMAASSVFPPAALGSVVLGFGTMGYALRKPMWQGIQAAGHWVWNKMQNAWDFVTGKNEGKDKPEITSQAPRLTLPDKNAQPNPSPA